MDRTKKSKVDFAQELKTLLAEAQNLLAKIEKGDNKMLSHSITYELILKNFRLGNEGLKGVTENASRVLRL